jgi:hypothetical protein
MICSAIGEQVNRILPVPPESSHGECLGFDAALENRFQGCRRTLNSMKALSIFLLLATSALAGELKWEATTQRIEVGPREREVRTQFPYRNAGRAPVRIESVRGVCVCCTAAHATKKLLAPGESGAVVMRVDFENKPLPLAKTVTVKTDEGATTVLTVEILAKPQSATP